VTEVFSPREDGCLVYSAA